LPENNDRLERVFRGVFKSLASEDEIATTSMASCKEWDSLNHMHLMLAVIEEFGEQNMSPERFAKLTSFEKILEVIVSDH
jgi:acyl carrier protein